MISELEWDQEKKEMLRRALDGVTEYPEGAVAVFVPLTERIGVKLFPKAEWRDFAVEKQTAAASYGLGPSAGGVFELTDDFPRHHQLQWKAFEEEGVRQFGYVTHRADTQTAPSEEEMKSLINAIVAVKKLGALPFDDFEDSSENFGYFDGRLVYLDFDYGTWN